MKLNAEAMAVSGIVPEHGPAITKVAKAREEIIIFRNVNKLCTSLIKEGYATKGLLIKPKSSDWGPQAGFLCAEQRYSKLEDEKDWVKFNHKVEETLSDKRANATVVHLTVTKARLEELVKAKAIETMSAVSDGFTIKAKKIEFHAKLKDKEYEIFIKKAPHREKLTGWEQKKGTNEYVEKTGAEIKGPFPMLVIAAADNKKPITADYDLFALCPLFGTVDLATMDKLLDPNVGTSSREKPPQMPIFQTTKPMNKLGPKIQEKILQLQASQKPKTDPTKGNYTARTLEFLKAINKELVAAGYKGGDLVHHGAESANPGTEFDYPIIAFDGDAVIALENEAELKQYLSEIRLRGRYIQLNPVWRLPTWKSEAGKEIQTQWGKFDPDKGWL